jgi:hypothetical protein
MNASLPAGKMLVLEKMLQILYHEKKERIVLISNYTQVYFNSFRLPRAPWRSRAGWHYAADAPGSDRSC